MNTREHHARAPEEATPDGRPAPTLREVYTRHSWHWMAPLALLAFIYAPVYPRMFNDWISDPNYSHGLLVPLVSAWFAYSARNRLKETPARVNPAGIALLFFGLAMLAAGLAVNELFTTRASIIPIVGGIILSLYGGSVLRPLALPLLFLIFMIPLPYTIYDLIALPLKSLVSLMATAGIKLCGLPVLREGNMIIFPNISLEVVDACSGMRSLISLMALGTAYAFLFLKGGWRRCLLIAATVPIAVLTNTLRVFVTGILARYMGAAAAEGFFHEFAGLAVFATAMILTMLTGWIVSRLGRMDTSGQSGPEAPSPRQDAFANESPAKEKNAAAPEAGANRRALPGRVKNTLAYGVVLLALASAAALSHYPRELLAPKAKDLQTFPTILGTWAMTSNTLYNPPTLKVLRPSGYVSRSYADGRGHGIGLYVGFHDGGPDSGPIHSPRNCLPGSGWYPVDNRELALDEAGEAPLRVVRAVYAQGGREIVYYYWYQVRGKSITSDTGLKLAELAGVLFERRKDAAFIRIDMDKTLPDAELDRLALNFINALRPALREFLPS